MLKAIGIWILIGVIGQVIVGMVSSAKVMNAEKSIGVKYDDRYTFVMWILYLKRVNPFARYSIDSHDMNILIYLIGNLFGWITWPIYVPTILMATDAAIKQFITDNSKEGS